jgi:hypothetical protein
LPLFPSVRHDNASLASPSMPLSPEPLRLVSVDRRLLGIKAAVMGMPLGRYFIFVGGVLLALLFAADSYMPQLPRPPARADVDHGIRVQSRHRWPERIVIDTSLPTIVPANAMAADLAPAAPPQAGSPRDAFALAAPEAPQARPPSSSGGRKPVQKRRAKAPRGVADPIAPHVPDGFRIALPAGW